MKKTLIVSIAAVALGLSTSALAQTAGPRSGTPTLGQGAGIAGAQKLMKMREEMLAKLNLTADQKAKIAVHDKETMEKRKAMRKTVGANPTEMRQKAMELRKENEEFMKGVLTKDQMKRLQQMRREAMKNLAPGAAKKPL